jgi:hypothetical protein
MVRNNSSLCKLLALAALVTSLALTVGSGVAWAQQAQPVQPLFQFTYFANGRQQLDGKVRITNGGSNASSSGNITNGDLCAIIYVFNKEKLNECCGCLVTADGGLELSINNNLTNNPHTGSPIAKGVIKLISTVPGTSGSVETCDPTNLFLASDGTNCPGGAGNNAASCPTAELGAWATHVQVQLPNQSFPVTEEEFWPATLSDAEVTALNAACSAIGTSGKGVCSCGTSF